MKHFLFTFLIFFISCNSQDKKNTVNKVRLNKLTQSNKELKSQISTLLTTEKLLINKSAKLFDSITTEYSKYLNEVSNTLTSIDAIKEASNYDYELSKEIYTNECFFLKDKYYTSWGYDFLLKMEEHKSKILELVKNKNLTKKINLSLNPEKYKINSESNEHKHIYRNSPLIMVLIDLKMKERLILEFEYEFLNNLQLTQ